MKAAASEQRALDAESRLAGLEKEIRQNTERLRSQGTESPGALVSGSEGDEARMSHLEKARSCLLSLNWKCGEDGSTAFEHDLAQLLARDRDESERVCSGPMARQKEWKEGLWRRRAEGVRIRKPYSERSGK
ncbi:hypothetical protein KFL_003740100 [Klebsormidium nitens]|uniref:Uncharacterized protein n=1 Tax=Klebsormidium nitens TaxID=105231 RepID=A0A1Y1IEA8_KLENI|nr:hypothetical protein KFL_003740100 [Klebsormidium nitens]|eukprot:GAQ87749.1 hypothetical protein KFL_003740100 [Klebsormidium nitens]